MTLNKRRDLRTKIAGGIAIAAIGGVLAAPTTTKAEEFEGPSFQQGMWAFERTLENVGPSSRLPNATFASKQEMLRCVDPTEAMKETFRSSNVGDCHSARPEKIDNRYEFSLRCDFTGPVRTVIEVGSDSRYTETNETAAGKFVKREIVIAHRVGDCGAPKVPEFELSSASTRNVTLSPLPPTRPTAVASTGFELSSASSRKVALSPLPPLPPTRPTAVASTGTITPRPK